MFKDNGKKFIQDQLDELNFKPEPEKNPHSKLNDDPKHNQELIKIGETNPLGYDDKVDQEMIDIIKNHAYYPVIKEKLFNSISHGLTKTKRPTPTKYLQSVLMEFGFDDIGKATIDELYRQSFFNHKKENK